MPCRVFDDEFELEGCPGRHIRNNGSDPVILCGYDRGLLRTERDRCRTAQAGSINIDGVAWPAHRRDDVADMRFRRIGWRIMRPDADFPASKRKGLKQSVLIDDGHCPAIQQAVQCIGIGSRRKGRRQGRDGYGTIRLPVHSDNDLCVEELALVDERIVIAVQNIGRPVCQALIGLPLGRQLADKAVGYRLLAERRGRGLHEQAACIRPAMARIQILLRAIIEVRDSSRGKQHGQRSMVGLVIRLDIAEACHVMIVDKGDGLNLHRIVRARLYEHLSEITHASAEIAKRLPVRIVIFEIQIVDACPIRERPVFIILRIRPADEKFPKVGHRTARSRIDRILESLHKRRVHMQRGIMAEAVDALRLPELARLLQMLDDDAVLLGIVGERSQFLMPVPEFGCIAVRPVPFMMEKAVRIVEDVGDSVLHLAVAVVINWVAVRVEHILAGAVAIRFIQHAVAVWPRARMVGHEIDNHLDPVVMKRINQRAVKSCIFPK